MLGSKRLCSAVSPMSAAPTSDTEKKNRNGANLKPRLALRAGGVKRSILEYISPCTLYLLQLYL